MPKASIGRLLEIGYGSAILFPELSQRCQELYGVDVHTRSEDVALALERAGIVARLQTADVSGLPYADTFFDCIVAISVLEFVADLRTACVEIARVLKPDGYFIVVTPGYSKLLDVGLKLLTGENASTDFAKRRQVILPMIGTYFEIQKRVIVPFIGGTIYTALKLRKLSK